MKSHEVIREAVDKTGVKAVAAALNVSAALIYKWCESTFDTNDQTFSGTKNPLDRVAEMYAITKDMRLVRWLCNEAGGFFVANPDPGTRSKTEAEADVMLYRQSRNLVRDFSALLDSITESVEDDHQVDADEADKIRQKWEDLKANVERFVLQCEQGHFRFTPRNK
jgi:hypothetical protein